MIFIKKLLEHQDKLREVIIHFLVPFIIILLSFYLPYIIYGFFSTNTANYLNDRLLGKEYSQNISWYTFWIYNPTLIWPLLTLFALPYFLKRAEWKNNIVVLWFLVAFITFEYIFSNPGTHIQNYILPLIMLIGMGISDLYDYVKHTKLKQLFTYLLGILVVLLILIDAFVYIPFINNGYPWKNTKFGWINIPPVTKNYNVFLYGFPYYRQWDEIRAYVLDRGGVRGFYTNDNDTLAQYYLRHISYTPPGSNFIPLFYVKVTDDQERCKSCEKFELENLAKYTIEKEFTQGFEKNAVLYKLIK